MIRRARKQEGGYALLVVLFLGALIAISLALSLPRAAFEAQRAREDDLIYRGSQYSRAVQLYFRKFRRYPASMDDLEKTNNIRFLRRKYIDPITQKDEWRIIHIGPGGVFTDSLVYDRPKQNQNNQDSGPAATPSSGAASPADPSQTTYFNQPLPNAGQQITGMADRLRASNAGTTPADPNAPPGSQGTPYGAQNYNYPGQPGYGNSSQSGMPGQFYVPGQSGMPAGTQAGIGAAISGSGYSGAVPGATTNPPFGTAAGFPGGLGTAQQGPYPAAGYPVTAAPPGYPAGAVAGSPAVGPAVGSEAARIIGQLLTTPRPGGLAGLTGPGPQPVANPFGGPSAGPFGGPGASSSPGGGSAFNNPSTSSFLGGSSTGAGTTGFGGGIAGVASKSEARGIKVYRDRETYNEWEFVYDYRRDPLLVGGAGAGTAGLPNQPGTPGSTGTASAFGQGGGSAFGQGSVFGQSSFGQPGGQPGQPTSGQPGGQPFGQPGITPPGQMPNAPINPTQPGLSPTPIGPPRLPTPVPPLAVPNSPPQNQPPAQQQPAPVPEQNPPPAQP